MIKRSLYIFFSLVWVIFGGCSKNDIEDWGDIGFDGLNNGVEEVVKAGSSLVDSDSELRGKAIGVYGLRSGTNSSFVTPVFETSDAKRIHWESSAWTYSPKAKWVRSNYYRFRAFWPYDQLIADDAVNASSNANLLSISYASGVQTYDLQVAYSEWYPVIDGVGTVNLQFKHVLSGLKFQVKFAEAETDYIESFYLKGLVTVGTLMYGEDGTNATAHDFRWIPIYTDNSSKLFEWTGSKVFTASTSATLFDGDGIVFIVPQTITDATSLNFTTQNGGSALHTATLPATTFQPGKIYSYTIVIKGAKISLTVDVEDWTDVDSNIDINL